MSSDNNTTMDPLCPICDNNFKKEEIEIHVNKCIFLNTQLSIDLDQCKRKRLESPTNEMASTKVTNLSSPSKKIKGNNVKLDAFIQIKSKSKIDVEESKEDAEPLDKLLNCFKGTLNDSQLLKNLKSQNNKSTDLNDLSEHDNSDHVLDGCNVKKFFTNVPLSTQVQPKNLNNFFGQKHILGKDTILRKLLENGQIPNMILWGPPGCGKTSLSAIIKETCKGNSKQLRFVALCAATAGIKEVQNIISVAKGELKFNRKTILFMDEIHRFNKRQQDVFLLHVEKGDIILIGATTENPSFTINSALLSRCRVIVMEKLKTNELVAILENATKQFGIQIVNVEENPFCTLKTNK